MARKPSIKKKIDKQLKNAKTGLVAAEVAGHPTAHALDVAKQSLAAAQHGSKAASLLGAAGKAVSAVASVTAKVSLPATALYGLYKAGSKYAEGGTVNESAQAGIDAVTFGLASYVTDKGAKRSSGGAKARRMSRMRSKRRALAQAAAKKSMAAKPSASKKAASRQKAAATKSGGSGAKRGFANPKVQAAAQRGRKAKA